MSDAEFNLGQPVPIQAVPVKRRGAKRKSSLFGIRGLKKLLATYLATRKLLVACSRIHTP